MKALTVKQPYASLICCGLKNVENRSWTTKYRGTILIHAGTQSGADLFDKDLPLPIFQEFDRITSMGGEKKADSELLDIVNERLLYIGPKAHLREFRVLKTEIAEQIDNESTLFLQAAIIGSVDIIDVIQDSKSKWSEPGNYHWILKNAKLFRHPVLEIKGHLKLWNHETTLNTSTKSFVKE